MLLRALSGVEHALQLLIGGSEALLRFLHLGGALVVERLLLLGCGTVKGVEVAEAHCGPSCKPLFGTILLGILPDGLARVISVFVDQELPGLALGRIRPLEQCTDLSSGEVALRLLRLEGRLCEAHLEDLQSEHLVLDKAAHDEPVDANLLGLANSVGAVHRLCICGGVPSRVHHDHTVGAGEVETDTADVRCEQHELESVMLLIELVDLVGARLGIRLAVDAQTTQAVWPQDTDLQQVEHLQTLREDQRAVPPLGERRQHGAETTKFRRLPHHGLGVAWQLPNEILDVLAHRGIICISHAPRAGTN
mmetsp:Transcript_1097/g.2270  ORF Transcript_1097/g.2270 Transcript_1097/m.2270 type:complete len:307 (+) Transcript_1097:1417-2337(+)